jgi:hypothetical protein
MDERYRRVFIGAPAPTTAPPERNDGQNISHRVTEAPRVNVVRGTLGCKIEPVGETFLQLTGAAGGDRCGFA